MRRQIAGVLGVCGVVAGCATQPPPVSPVVQVAPSAAGTKQQAARTAPAAARTAHDAAPAAAKDRVLEPRKVVAQRVLAGLRQLDEERPEQQ